MVHSCCAYGCTNRQLNGTVKSFHRFPINEVLRKLWIKNVRRQNWTPTLSARLCSDHFTSDCFVKRLDATDGDLRLLKGDAFPTVFSSFPTYLQRSNKPTRKSPTKRSLPEATAEDDENIPPSPTLVSMASQTDDVRYKSTEYYRKKIRALQSKLARRDRRIDTMGELLEDLKERNLITSDQFNLLEDKFSGMQLDVIRNEFENSLKLDGRRYSQAVKEFALTLHFYSSAAYEFLRKILTLPHPNVIRNWTISIEGNPGFIMETISYVAYLIRERKKTGQCCLMFDSMAIKKQTVWDPSSRSYKGFVDYGNICLEAQETLASEVLVFHLVPFDDSWTYPVAHFFINKITAEIQCQLIIDCISLLLEHGIIVKATVCDGTFTNQDTGRLLGANLNVQATDPSFPNPCFEEEKIYFLIDACHLMKLMRNLLADYRELMVPKISKTEPVCWKFIEKLHEIQSTSGLKLGNRLTKQHIQFRNRIMNVKLAVQVFSKSTAAAIDYLREDEKLPYFKNSEATSKFLRTMDLIFDRLNSRSQFGKYEKSALRLGNKHIWAKDFDSVSEIIQSISDTTGNLIGSGKRKTVIVGFLSTIKGTLSLSHSLLMNESSPLKYVLTYKCSQDHLELFFSKIRRRGGWNNNPNQLQFRSALRTVALKNSVLTSKSTNCKNFQIDHEPLSLFSFMYSERKWGLRYSDETPAESPDFALVSEYLFQNMDSLQDNILYYICGFISRKIIRSTNCQTCLDSLSESSSSMASCLTVRKDYGGLLYASESLLKVVKYCETLFRFYVVHSPTGINSTKNLSLTMISRAVQHVIPDATIFRSLLEHELDSDVSVEDGHRTQIVRKISQVYLKLRLQTYGKCYSIENVHSNVTTRQKLTKLILFNNQ